MKSRKLIYINKDSENNNTDNYLVAELNNLEIQICLKHNGKEFLLSIRYKCKINSYVIEVNTNILTFGKKRNIVEKFFSLIKSCKKTISKIKAKEISYIGIVIMDAITRLHQILG